MQYIFYHNYQKLAPTSTNTAFMYDPRPLVRKGMYLSPTKHENFDRKDIKQLLQVLKQLLQVFKAAYKTAKVNLASLH